MPGVTIILNVILPVTNPPKYSFCCVNVRGQGLFSSHCLLPNTSMPGPDQPCRDVEELRQFILGSHTC